MLMIEPRNKISMNRINKAGPQVSSASTCEQTSIKLSFKPCGIQKAGHLCKAIHEFGLF